MKASGYQSIAQTIRERIVSGHYTPGEKIPSIRRLADDFGCNKLTVHRAFDTLKQEGLIENRVGSGTYVRFPEKVAAPQGIFDFHTDYLDESLFPYQQIQTIFNQLFKDEGAHALAPTPAEGDSGLIHILSQFYHVSAQQMVIISGAQQGLDLVAKVFAANIADAMLFEDPTYPGALSLFKARHFVVLHDDGPDLDALEKLLTQTPIRLFYTMPKVHNPTGMAYGEEKKAAIANLARRHGFYIVEDDFLSEFRLQNGSRFADICPEQTIHIKSLSQTTVSGIRLGFMVVPEKLFNKFLYAKFSSDIASFGLMQRCMGEFLKQGFYQKHLKKVEQIISYRKKRLCDLIDTLDHLSYSPHQAGFSLWVKSGKALPPSPVPWTPGEDFSFKPQTRYYFRLSFMHMDDATFEKGVDYLARLWGASVFA
jgi:DNA-binding transcriptional MocR family regulator